MNPTATAARNALERPVEHSIVQTKTPTTMPTLVEIKQQELEQEVCRIYKGVAEADPNASWHKKAVQVAATTGLSPEGVKKILERNGITNPNKRGQQ